MFNKEGCRLKFFNIAFFASVMGFGGLALATHKLELVYKTNTHFAHYILYSALTWFIIISLAYFIKIFINFSDIKKDFISPVKSNFFPGIGKVFLIFAIGFLAVDMNIARIFWILGVSIQSIFTIIIFRRWMLHEQDIKSMNPLWFLPIVGNMLAPVAGVKLGYIELSWFFFSIGFIMWAVMFTIIMNRVIFHNPLAQKLMPTLFILIAPPAVALISLTTLNNGIISDFAKMLFYFMIFMFIIISKINILSKLKFYMSWWAYSFPMAVTTTATILFYSKTHITFFYYLGWIFYSILWFIIFILIYNTYKGFRKKELCIEE